MPPAPRSPEGGRTTPLAPELLSLAPLELPNRRRVRSVADELFVAVDDFVASDRAALRSVYASLNALLEGLTNPDRTDAARWKYVENWCADPERGLDQVFPAIQRLGQDTLARGRPTETMLKVLHDVRGGALSALLGHLALLPHLPRNEPEMRLIFVLTRDHLKIMRNSLTGLDDQRRNADRSPRSHALRLVLEKWHGSVVGPQLSRESQPLHMFVDSRYEGALTQCCLESAAIDRIFYNLAANASRHCRPGGRLDMSIFPLPPEGRNLRFVLSNPVRPDHVETLRNLGEPDLGETAAGVYLDTLFDPAVTSTGSGYGLTVVADFVAGAFGLPNMAAAVRGRYVGVRLDGDIFRVFFHWPVARDDFPAKLDDLHQPHLSVTGK